MSRDRPFSLGLPVLSTFVALGLVARTWHYAANYSLNHDDACLALNVLERTVAQLLEPLDYEQAAPLGFLLVERALVALAGGNEHVLRLVPWLASLASVVAFSALASRTLDTVETVAAVAFFAVSQALVSSSGAVKQYSLEVLVTILVLLACRDLLIGRVPDRKAVTTAALAGAAALWFSFPAVFVLGGVGLASLAAADPTRERWVRCLPAYAVWVASAALAYLFSMRPGLQNAVLRSMWQADFLPLGQPQMWLPWIVHAATNLAAVGFSVRLAPLGALGLAVAIVTASRRRQPFDLALVFILGLTLLASCLQRYPFVGRFLFFAAPVVLLLIGEQIGGLVRAARPRVRAAGGVVVAVAVLYATGSLVWHDFLHDPAFDDPRGAFADARRGWRPGDLVYASDAAAPSFLYYAPRLGFDASDVVITRPRRLPAHYQSPIGAIPRVASRVWIVSFEPNERGFESASWRATASPAR